MKGRAKSGKKKEERSVWLACNQGRSGTGQRERGSALNLPAAEKRNARKRRETA